MIIREIQMKDIDQCLNLLSQLTMVGDIENQEDILNQIKQQNITIYVIEDNNSILGISSILIEQKFIHNGGRVGHIEDVVVNKKSRGLGVGKMLIEKCVEKAKQEGCYKVILDCDRKNVGFYTKCGFHEKDVCMRLDL